MGNRLEPMARIKTSISIAVMNPAGKIVAAQGYSPAATRNRTRQERPNTKAQKGDILKLKEG
jgi:hypothetical protein